MNLPMTLQGDEGFDIDSDSLTGVNRGLQHWRRRCAARRWAIEDL
jgi:hypothetical protein